MPAGAGTTVAKVTTLRKQRDFKRLYAQGRRFRSPLLTLVVLQQPPGGGVRVAFVVSNKVGKAVTRNKLRRRLREAFRRLLPRIGCEADIAIIARQKAACATYQELADTLSDLLAGAGLVH